MKCLVFEVAKERFAIDINGLIAVTRVLKMKPVDSFREEILGVVSIKGSLQPVVQINKLFKLPKTDLGVETKFISVVVKNATYTLVADKIEHFIDLEEGTYEPPPVSINSNFISYVSSLYNIEVLNIDQIYQFLNTPSDEVSYVEP